jgi:pimeloyl-ACP methyl ester carboxylesterase
VKPADVKRAYARDCNGIRIHYVESGVGQPVVFLHGFPDFSYSWRHQFPALSRAGFRCIAPDLRGVNETDKPKHVSDYRTETLVADMVAFIQQVAGGQAVLVGHDWGGIIAWRVAMQHPALVRKLVILNSPHPSVYVRRLRRGRQMLRSWYALAFQLPLLPELFLSSFHFRLLTGAAARTDAEREIYEEAFSQPKALRSALNYYRAAFRDLVMRRKSSRTTRINVPTLVLWGDQDRALGTELLEGLEQYVDKLTIMRFRDVGHWVHIDAADRVNEEMLRFLKA